MFSGVLARFILFLGVLALALVKYCPVFKLWFSSLFFGVKALVCFALGFACFQPQLALVVQDVFDLVWSNILRFKLNLHRSKPWSWLYITCILSLLGLTFSWCLHPGLGLIQSDVVASVCSCLLFFG